MGRKNTVIQSFTLTPDAKIKLKLLALQKGTSMSALIDKMVDDMWENEKDGIITKVPASIRKEVKKIVERMTK